MKKSILVKTLAKLYYYRSDRMGQYDLFNYGDHVVIKKRNDPCSRLVIHKDLKIECTDEKLGAGFPNKHPEMFFLLYNTGNLELLFTEQSEDFINGERLRMDLLGDKYKLPISLIL